MRRCGICIVIFFICFCAKKNDAIETKIKKNADNKQLNNEVVKCPINFSSELQNEYFNIENDSLKFNFVFDSFRCVSVSGYAIVKDDSLIIVHDNTRSRCDKRMRNYNVRGQIPYNNNLNFNLSVISIDKFSGQDISKGTEKLRKKVTFIKKCKN